MEDSEYKSAIEIIENNGEWMTVIKLISYCDNSLIRQVARDSWTSSAFTNEEFESMRILHDILIDSGVCETSKFLEWIRQKLKDREFLLMNYE